MNAVVFRRLLKAVLPVYAGDFLLMLLAAAIVSRGEDPVRSVMIPAYAILIIGAFACGFLCSHGSDQTVLCGLLAAGGYLLPLFFISLCLPSMGTPLWMRGTLYAGAALAAFCGALAGGYRRPRRISPARSRENIRRKYLMQKHS